MKENHALRALAIAGIALHNYCHWLPSTVRENEYRFLQHNVDAMTDLSRLSAATLPIDLLSFFGHYGVPVFLFLSGYGLACKYETGGRGGTLWSFTRYNYLKLLRLLVVGFVLFFLVDAVTPGTHRYPFADLCGTLLMVGNFMIMPDQVIWPGPYWYFGLTIQLYLVYRLLFYHYRQWWVLLGAVLLCTALQVWAGADSGVLLYLRYNCIGGMLPFVFGIAVARHSAVLDPPLSPWQRLLLFIGSSLAIVLSSLWFATWLFTPLFVVVAALSLVRLFPDVSASRPVQWVGSISAAIFIVHPILRKIVIRHYHTADQWTGLLAYAVATLVVAWLVQLIINKIPRPTE